MDFSSSVSVFIYSMDARVYVLSFCLMPCRVSASCLCYHLHFKIYFISILHVSAVESLQEIRFPSSGGFFVCVSVRLVYNVR